MSAPWSACVIVLGVAALSLSCQDLVEERVSEGRTWGAPGTLAVDSLGDSLSVPAEWGDVVGVSDPPGSSPNARLWLQDGDGTIRMVTYDRSRQVLWPLAVVIHRR